MAKNKNTSKTNKVESEEIRIKDKNGNYIYHRLMSRTMGFIIESLGEDPTRCMKALDDYYFDFRRKVAAGKVRKGTEFDFYIVRASGNPQMENVVQYIPGSSSKRKFVSYDDYEDDYDDYEDEYADY